VKVSHILSERQFYSIAPINVNRLFLTIYVVCGTCTPTREFFYMEDGARGDSLS
jgi:hypothetical protein